MTQSPAARLIAYCNAFLDEWDAKLAAAAAPAETREQRIKKLVKEVYATRDQQRAAALAVQIRDTIEEAEPTPAPKTPEELAQQRIQDERAWMELISKKAETA